MPRAVDGMKVCSKCKLNREVAWFFKDKIRPDGLRGWCRECNMVVARERHRRNKDTCSIQLTGNKTCITCGEIKDVNLFCAHYSKKDGRDSRCKTCNRARNNKTRADNLEWVRENERLYRMDNRDTINLNHRIRYHDNRSMGL